MSRQRAWRFVGLLVALLAVALCIFVLLSWRAEGPTETEPDTAAAPLAPADTTALGGPPPNSTARPSAERNRTRVRQSPAVPIAEDSRLEVLVTDGGTPVAGARVVLMAESAIRSRKARGLQIPAGAIAEGRTDADGVASFATGERWSFRAVAESGARAGAAPPIRSSGSGTTRIEVPLADGVRARGVVLAAGDRPVPGADISIALVGAWVAMGNRFGIGWSATADDAGRFDLGTLPVASGTDGYVVRVRGDAIVDFDREIALDELRVDPVLVRVRGFVSVRGVVRRRDGGPAAIARVRLFGRETHTDDGGVFEFQNVPDVGGQLHALGRFARASSTEVGPFTEAENDLGEIWLDISDVIAGHVRDENGEPVPGIRVGAGISNLDWRWTETDAHGRFELFDVAATEHRIEVTVPKGASCVRADGEPLTALPGDRELALVLSRP